MTQQDQDALTWAKANPHDPRSIHIQAKTWANDHPEDPRSAQILDRISKANSTPPDSPQPGNNTPPQPTNQSAGNPPSASQPQAGQQSAAPAPQGPPPPNPFDVANTQQQASQDDEHAKTRALVKQIMKPTSEGGMTFTSDDINQMASNLIAPGMAGIAAKGMGLAGRLGIGSLLGAAQGFSSSPTNHLGGAAAGGVVGAVGSTALEGLQSILGGIKGAAGNIGTAMQIHKADPDLYQAARSKIEDAMSSLGNPGPSQNQGGEEYLRQMTSKPITNLTTPNVDKRAMINGLGAESGTDLADYAKTLRMAKQTASNPLKSGLMNTVKAGFKGATNVGSSQVNDPGTLSTILNMIQSQPDNK